MTRIEILITQNKIKHYCDDKNHKVKVAVTVYLKLH